MNHLYLLSSSTLIGTIIVTLTYIYLYAVYRERYMGLWMISWFIFFGRLIIFDYGPIDWKQSIIGFTIYEFFCLCSGLLFLWGVNFFIGKPVDKRWLHAGIYMSILGTAFTFFHFSLPLRLAPIVIFSGLIIVMIGKNFICDLKMRGSGHLINGTAFILWGILTIIMPYTITIPWLSPWCYLAGGILRLVIACGTLLVYFERTRLSLISKETQYRLLAENALDVIYRYKVWPEAKFEYMSPSALKITGYAPEEFYANPMLLVMLIEADYLPLGKQAASTSFLQAKLPMTFRLKRKDQTSIWIEQTCVSIHNDEGKLIALEGIIRDITTRKNMEQMVTRLDKLNMVGQMAASVAHEIRNPLTSVRGYLQLMQRNQKDPNDIERFELMISELDRTNTIISEYLMLAQDKVPNLEDYNLNALVNVLYPLMQATAVSSNMSIRLSLKDVPNLFIDKNEIRQLLLNLVKNGLEAMKKGGELVIGTCVNNGKVILSVSDQGPGIPAHVLDNLGTPFLTSKVTGTGLGLSICYRIVNRHNADIHVETSDQGTTFFIEFQTAEAAA